MPFPLLIPLITAAVGAAGQIGQAVANRKADKRANQYAIDAQNRANAENERFWNLQNDYNSPNAQMQRLKQAGLNPNLIYGNGATTQAGSVAASKAAPQRSTSNAGAFSQVASTIGQALQNDNLRAQNTLLVQNAALTQAKTASELTKNARGTFDLVQLKRLKDVAYETAVQSGLQSFHRTNQEAAKATSLGVKANVDVATEKSQVTKILTDAKVAAANLTGVNRTNALKQYEVELNQIFMNQKDPRVKAALMIIQKLLNSK